MFIAITRLERVHKMLREDKRDKIEEIIDDLLKMYKDGLTEEIDTFITH
jgi:hypothetical protein